MQSHVRTLGILHIVFGGLGVLLGIVALFFFGGIAGLISATEHDPDAALAVPIMGMVGTIIFLISLLLSLPGIVAGIGLLSYKPWARILTIVLSFIHIVNVPIGTAVGVYGLWVLFSPDVTATFEGRGRYVNSSAGPAVR
jgi:hypothetical protein